MTKMERLRRRWRMIWLGLTLMPMAGAQGEDEDEDDGGGEADDGGTDAPAGSSEAGDDGGDEEEKPEEPESSEDYRRGVASSRKEADRLRNQAKREKREREKLEKRLKEIEDKDKSEQEKAVEKARKEGEETAHTKAEKERRADRLESASIRVAARGVEIEQDGEKGKFRFADPDDAMLHLQRAISQGDVDAEEIYDDAGKVKAGVLEEALRGILVEKPYLRAGGAGEEKPTPKPKGGSDGGKGDENGKDLESMSVDDHFQRIRKHKDPA